MTDRLLTAREVAELLSVPAWLARRMAEPCPTCGVCRDDHGRWADTGRWVGAVYCSNACKQRAYRVRVTAVAPRGTTAVTEANE